MAINFAQRLHVLLHGMFRPSDAVEARTRYDELAVLLTHHGLHTAKGREEYIYQVLQRVCLELNLSQMNDQATAIQKLIQRLFDFEGWFLLPEIDWEQRHSISEYWTIRDEVAVQRKLVTDFEQTETLIAAALTHMLEPIVMETQEAELPDGITVPTSLLHITSNLPGAIEQMIGTVGTEEIVESGLFPRLERNLDRNLIRASGGNPDDPSGFSRALKLPSQMDIRDPAVIVDTYLAGTPLYDLFSQQVDFTIPTKTRYSHGFCLAGSGHGKTQTLQYLIAQDLEAVERGERTVVVIDSQGDLIKNISNLDVFAPGGPLHDRITIIDPTDVEWPVSLNMFDVGLDRLKDYEALERERLTNSILELYDFVLGTLLDAGMTQKQSVIFRYVTRLMLHIPDATIHTLRELMEPGAEKKFAEHIAKLSGSARHFFDTEFAGKEFVQTKQQVLRRLWGILENQTFERMFSHPRSKFDMFSEMNAGRVILINTAKDLLKEQGTQIFGRFFIALITQAAQERATLPQHQRLSTMVYVDEAADYFDRNIGTILEQARKQNVGLFSAAQYWGQLDSKLQESMASNTAIKFAGGVSAKDARTLAPMMYCEPGLIESQPKGSFAAFVRGTTKGAVPLQFPLGYMENLPQMEAEQRQALKQKMRDRYAVHISKLQTDPPDEEAREIGEIGSDNPTPLPPEKPDDSGQPDTKPSNQW